MDGFFNMVMIVEIKDSKIKLQDLQKILSDKGQEINLDIKAQHPGYLQCHAQRLRNNNREATQ